MMDRSSRWSPASTDHSQFCVAAGLVRRATSKAVCEALSPRSAATGPR
jgi:hypothetical protein